VSAEWLAAHHCDVRIVDVRELDEIEGELGRVPGSEWVSISDVARAAERWDRSAPIVLVCRSGRRSARAAEQLEALGFRSVASLTGGMLEWNQRRLSTERGPLPSSRVIAVQRARAVSPSESPLAQRIERDTEAHGPVHSAAHGSAQTSSHWRAPLSAEELRRRIEHPSAVRWTTAATVLSAGTESCIDGRSSSPVLGAPGGDVGELVLALTALEQSARVPIREGALDAMMDEYADSFGRLYWHTDEHTMDALQRSLAADERVPVAQRPADRAAALAFVRRPPAGLESVVIEHATRPENVGCGHLRAMLERPDAYQTRAPLVRAVLGAVLRLGWRRPEVVDLEVLEGEHHERAVIEVRVAREVHAHSRVPMVVPTAIADGAFVLHPQVESFVRAESADFLSEFAESLVGKRVSMDEYVRTMQALGAVQVRRTLARLAATLPAFEVEFARDGRASVRVAPPWGER
jgi:rhodanese-related sulfurtransferase